LVYDKDEQHDDDDDERDESVTLRRDIRSSQAIYRNSFRGKIGKDCDPIRTKIQYHGFYRHLGKRGKNETDR